MRTWPIILTRISRERPTGAMRQLKWSVIIALFGAVAAGFVAGKAAGDVSPVSHGAGRSAIASANMPPAGSATYAIAFPEANRTTKGDRLRVGIAGEQVGAAIKRGTRDVDRRPVQSRPPREAERKPLMHCEPLGSPLADPAVLRAPPRSCLARLGTLPQYALLGLDALHAS